MPRSPSSEPKRSSLTPFYALLGVVALAGIGVLLFQLYGREPGATEPVPVVMDPAALQRVQGVSVGREDAPVVVYEFADFQCPGCGQFAAFTVPLIKQRFVDSGQVRYVYYDYPLVSIHQNSFLAARAGRCAKEQGRFWEMHDYLYAKQPEWSIERDPTELFVGYAEQAGANADAFEACLRSDRYAREVTESMRLAESLGVQGTPTLFINGKRLDQTPSVAELDRLIRAELGGAMPAAADSTGPAVTAG